MTCTASHAIEQLISDAAEKRGGTPVSVLHQKTREVVVYEKTANLVAEIAAAASKG
jgi:hypothetical protein